MKTEDIIFALRAGYSFFYVQTYEMDRAVESISKAVTEYKNGSGECPFTTALWDFEIDKDPEECLFTVLDNGDANVVVAKNFNWFLWDDYGKPNKMFISFLQNRFEMYTTDEYRKAFIIVSDASFDEAIPGTLQKEFLPIMLGLPGDVEVTEVYDFIVESAKGNPRFKEPNGETKKMLIDAAKGMTKREIKNAYSYSLITDKGELVPKTVSRLKARDIEKTAGLKIGDYAQTFDTLKGYSEIKKFFLATVKNPLAKGILLLGPPGTGKTHFCRCGGNATGLPVFDMEAAEMFGSLVGESEKLWRRALEVVSLNAPCILFIDK